MKKIPIQLLALVVLFFGSWFVLKQVDWVTVLKVKQKTKKTEEKLGDFFWDMIKKSEKESTSSFTITAVNKLKISICKSNNIDSSKIKIHIIEKDEINAFALPNNHLVIFTGLIEACEEEAELSGIIGHEIAHMEKNHLMKKLVNEVGLTALISITTGNTNSELIKSILKILTSSSYSRKLETEADLTAVDYLIKAKISPEPLANFMFRLAQSTNTIPTQFYWISTHPDSEERAKTIIDALKNKSIINVPVLKKENWDLMKKDLKKD